MAHLFKKTETLKRFRQNGVGELVLKDKAQSSNPFLGLSRTLFF